MQPTSLKWLNDIADAATFIVDVTVGRSRVDYGEDRVLRLAVERSFEIIGEALLRLERRDPATAARIPDYRKIIGFRNRLAHGYDDIDYEQVWEIIERFLPTLRQAVDRLLSEAEADG